jgi:hypothetical protein
MSKWINVYTFDLPRDGRPFRTLSRHLSPKAAAVSMSKTQDKVLSGKIPGQDFEIWVGRKKLSPDVITEMLISDSPEQILIEAIANLKQPEPA